MASLFSSPSSLALVAFPSSQHHTQNGGDSQQEPPESEREQWQPILHASNQIVLYNPRSHALSIAAASSEGALPGGGVAVTKRRRRSSTSRMIGDVCPYCKQDLPADFSGFESTPAMADDTDVVWEGNVESTDEYEEVSSDPAYHSRASDYFQLLAIANETSSRRPSRGPSPYRVDGGGPSRGRSESRLRDQEGSSEDNRSTRGAFPADKMAEGYFKTFFQEEYKLGMGANGTVYLCQHVLDGNPLGHFAVKKIAVGESHSYLLRILKEVRLLERLHHPNIITYHHAWLENAQFSPFGPKVPTLHVLMQWAEGGSLDDFIDVRLGRKSAHIHMHPVLPTNSTFDDSIPSSPTLPTQELRPEDSGPTTPTQKSRFPQFASAGSPGQPSHASLGDTHSRSARIRAFRAYQRAPPGEKERMKREMEGLLGPSTPAGGSGAAGKVSDWTPVHLLSAQEVKSLFQDVVEGLSFLHDKSILHLDLKPGNVLLTWDEGRLIPRAMLSDFGTSRDMIKSTRTPRSGNTGTLEYTAPESLPSPQTGLLQQIDSKADMWSLGMILHKLLFFKLPYRYAAVGDAASEPVSRERLDEGAKMDRLEKEVLEYPGFKSTPNLVVGFEARRLPRAFLVLLENLLHKMPAGRPSCERVGAAIREGKLDPLGEPTTETLSLGRPRPDLSGTPPEGSAVASTSTVTEMLSVDTSRLLSLPPPSEILGSDQPLWRRWVGNVLWTYHYTIHGVIGRDMARPLAGISKRRSAWTGKRKWRTGLRVLRSVLLGLKATSIAHLYHSSATHPRSGTVTLLIAAALTDAVIDHDAFFEVYERRVPEKDGQRRPSREWRKEVRRKALESFLITLGLAAVHVVVLSVSGPPYWHLRGWWN